MCGYFAPYYSAQDEAAPFMACGERGYTAWQPGIKERKAGDPGIPPGHVPMTYLPPNMLYLLKVPPNPQSAISWD